MLKLSGIYKISNIKNGYKYIGSSNDLLRRKEEHFRALKCKKHCNYKLQIAYNENDFIFSIIELTNNFIEREQYYINILSPEYNIHTIVERPGVGMPRSEETKEKISIAQRGSKNHIYGKKLSDTHKKKISRGLHTFYENNESKLIGKHHTVEHNEKIAIAGKGRIITKETRDKLSKANTGHIVSVETREKISKNHVANKSEEDKKIWTDKLKLAWSKRKK